jgi:hypothetical protein
MRLFLTIFWLAFIGYAFLFAPNGDGPYLQQLLTLSSPDPLLLMVFSLLGIYPMAYAALLLRYDDGKIPKWPFASGAFLFGAFSLLPYYIAGKWVSEYKLRTPKKLLTLLYSKIFILGLVVLSLGLIFYGVFSGDMEEYRLAFRTSQFVHVMTIDFFVLSFLSIYAIYHHSKWSSRSSALSWIGMIPVFGILIYLWIDSYLEGNTYGISTNGSRRS